MSEGAWSKLRRIALSQEDTIYTTDGAWTQLRGLEDAAVLPTEEVLSDNRHKTARKSNYAPHLGEKGATLGFRLPWHDALVGDASPLLESAFGFKSTNSLTFNAAGSSDGIVVKSAGTHDPIVLATYDSIIYARPVKSVSSNDATLAIKLAGTPTAATNADATNGACYYYDPTVVVSKYIQVEADRAGENDSLPWILKGGYVTSMTLDVDLGGRMGFGFGCQFHSWSQAAASNVSNPTALSGHFLGLSGEAFLQSASSPAVGTQLDVARVSVDLVIERLPRKAMRAPAGTVPDSSVVGVYPGSFGVGGIKVTYTKVSSTPLTDFQARTPKWGFFTWHMGRPGASTTKDIVALSLPRLIPAALPVEVEIDGIVGYEVDYMIEEDISLTAPYGLPSLAIGSAA
jgi:hypothetical protein